MTRFTAVVFTAIFAFVLSTRAIEGQWINHPTAGVPKGPNGKPNLDARAPRTPDGRPDLSGIWEPVKNRPCPPEGCADMQISQEFLDAGWSLKGGLPYQPWAADLVKERMRQNGKDDPTSHCLAAGIVKMHTTPLLRKFIQMPGLVAILNERNAAYRQIFTDGRAMPKYVDLPSASGFSVGKWEGDALVVQSTGFPDGLWLDRSGSPLTEAAKITERFRRPSYGKLEIEITVDDPKAYTRPWTIKLNQSIVLNTELIDYMCLENEKDAAHLVGQ